MRNCGVPLSGEYCAACGQRHEPHVHTLTHFAAEAFESITHADSRVWRTLLYLLTRPGLLTREFLAGRRVSYLPPFRLYLVISVVFFLVGMPEKVSVKPQRPSDTFSAAELYEQAKALEIPDNPLPEAIRQEVRRLSARGGGEGRGARSARRQSGRGRSSNPRPRPRPRPCPPPRAAPPNRIPAQGRRTSTSTQTSAGSKTSANRSGNRRRPKAPFAKTCGSDACAWRAATAAPWGRSWSTTYRARCSFFLPLLAMVMKAPVLAPEAVLTFEHLLFLIHNHAFVFSR